MQKFILHLVHYSGMERLFSRFSSQKRLIITYHGIVKKKDTSICNRHITQDEFTAHIHYLKKHFDIIPLREMVRLYRENIVPQKHTIAITFDDGYENNFIYAFPLLKLLNVPATFFVTAKCIEDENHLLWFDFFDFLKIEPEKINWSDIALDEDKKNILKSIKKRAVLKSFVKTLNVEGKNIILNKLKTYKSEKEVVKEVPLEFWKMLNTEQIRKIAGIPLFEIGSHSYSHHNMGRISLPDAEYELTHSKHLLEQCSGQEVLSFAFPDGKSYSDAVKKMAVKAGYKNLLTLEYQCESDGADRSILPRFCIHNDSCFYSNMLHLNYAFNKLGF